MTFSRGFGDWSGGVAGALAVVALCAVLALSFNLALALGILPAQERREREIPLALAAVSVGMPPVRLSANEVVVHVGASGEIRVGGGAKSVPELGEILARLVEEAGDAALTVRADERAPHGLVAKILAAARRAGIREASLLVIEEAIKDPGTATEERR